jgi:hypothetical protein
MQIPLTATEMKMIKNKFGDKGLHGEVKLGNIYRRGVGNPPWWKQQ